MSINKKNTDTSSPHELKHVMIVGCGYWRVQTTELKQSESKDVFGFTDVLMIIVLCLALLSKVSLSFKIHLIVGFWEETVAWLVWKVDQSELLS